MKKWTRMFFTAVLGAAFLAGAAPPLFPGVETKGKVQMGGEKSFYERLGGKKAITAVVDAIPKSLWTITLTSSAMLSELRPSGFLTN